MNTALLQATNNEGGTLTAQLASTETTTAHITPVPNKAPGLITCEPGTINEEAIYYKSRNSGAGTISGLIRDYTNTNGGVGKLHDNGSDWETLQATEYLNNIVDALMEGFYLEHQTCTKVTTSSFTVEGNQTAFYTASRQIRINGSINAVVANSSYSSPNTTVVVEKTPISTVITSVELAIQPKGTTHNDGWQNANETWTYASDYTVNTLAGGASKYAVGDRVKFTQTTVKYFVVTAVADTLLTFAVNTDFVVTDAAITLNYYSHEANPIGYPHWFNYSPTITWTAGTAPSGTPTKYERYYIVGNICTVNIHNFSYTAGETVTGATITTPVSPNGFFAAYGAITSGVTPNLSLADVTNGGGGRLFCTSVSADRIKFGASFKF